MRTMGFYRLFLAFIEQNRCFSRINGGVIPNDGQVADCAFLLPLLPKKEEGRGENFPTKDSRIEPLNLEKPTTSVSLAPNGG